MLIFVLQKSVDFYLFILSMNLFIYFFRKFDCFYN